MIIGLFKLNLNTTPHRSILYDGTKRVPKLVAILKLQYLDTSHNLNIHYNIVTSQLAHEY